MSQNRWFVIHFEVDVVANVLEVLIAIDLTVP